MDIRKLIKVNTLFTYRQKIVGLIMCGTIVGLVLVFAYYLRLHTYLIGDDPGACVNCHIMTPYYATWAHSSKGTRMSGIDRRSTAIQMVGSAQ